MIQSKNIQKNKETLGQFFTKKSLCKELLKTITIEDNSIIIEPSFGEGSFIETIDKNYIYKKILGIELDASLYNNYKPNKDKIKLLNKNYYDFNYDISKLNKYKIYFIGNPPYRTPALSLKTHQEYIKKLCSKYNIVGIKEECVFFILKTLDLIVTNNLENV
jgi:16S rRNA A1518/A1519 N6-dimethyltransferase RsmA/KsgA/DIM1 with predicted DNA glycosylase/AP lyase activity